MSPFDISGPGPLPDCDARKDTLLGFQAVCCLPKGHDGNHASADFVWYDDMNWATVRERP